MPRWCSLGFQDSSSWSIVELFFFHDYVIIIMTLIVVLIVYVMVITIVFSKYYKRLVEGTIIETVWSLIPSIFLIFLVIPSLVTLYINEYPDIVPVETWKVVGHQWYWRVEQSSLSGDYYLKLGDFTLGPRLLSTSRNFPLLGGFTRRFIVTSVDVIHSFSIPSIALKIDAVPGRINIVHVTPFRLGIFYGQCSEICGYNHSFIPFSVEVVDSLGVLMKRI